MDEFITRWHFVRSETLEILGSLDDSQLQFKPDGDKWQALFYQFSCMARTQLVYAIAAETGVMDFAVFGSKDLPSKDDYQTREALTSFLHASDKRWLKSLANNHGGVMWPDAQKSLNLHIAALTEHERLHHGQLISYFTLAGFELPKGFKRNWAL